MLQIVNASVSYKRTRVLEDISLTVQPGEIVAITGTNGCGKTTLLRAVAGLVRVDGRVIVTPDSRGNVPVFSGFVETPKLWNHLTGKENVAFFLGDFYRKEIVEVMLSEWDLASVDDTLVKKYSQGMRQKLALVIAFASQSSVLLLDEPTNALDVDGIRLFCKYVNQAAQEKRIVLIVTHDTHHLRRIVTKEFQLRNGSLYENLDQESDKELFYIRFASRDERNEALRMFVKEQDVREGDDYCVILSEERRSISEYIRIFDKFSIVGVGKYQEIVNDSRRSSDE